MSIMKPYPQQIVAVDDEEVDEEVVDTVETVDLVGEVDDAEEVRMFFSCQAILWKCSLILISSGKVGRR